MDLASKYFNDIDWRYVDHSSGLAPMQSFAFDDTFSESVGKDLSCNVVRTWIHQHTVILGIHDSRLPFLKDGIRYLTDEIGYNAIVRNSGGLGVVLDQGVLNISLIFKGQTETTIDEAFTVMYLLICKMFENEDVEIDTERAEMMRVFYEHALKGEVTKFKYPDIQPECMASLETLFGREIKVQDVMFQLLHAIKDLGGNLNMDPITEDEWTGYEAYFDKLIDRNEKLNRSIEYD